MPSLLYFCSHADHQRRSSDHHYMSSLCCFWKKRFVFSQLCNRKPSGVSGHKGIWMHQRRLLAQRSDVTLKTPTTWLSSPEAEDAAVSALGLLSVTRPALSSLCDCGSNIARTLGGAHNCIQPQRPRAIFTSSPSTNSTMMSSYKSQIGSIHSLSSQRLSIRTSRVCFTKSPGCVRRIWWQRGWSGPRRTPEPLVVPCPSLPHGTPPPPPRLREKTHTHTTSVNTQSE